MIEFESLSLSFSSPYVSTNNAFELLLEYLWWKSSGHIIMSMVYHGMLKFNSKHFQLYCSEFRVFFQQSPGSCSLFTVFDPFWSCSSDWAWNILWEKHKRKQQLNSSSFALRLKCNRWKNTQTIAGICTAHNSKLRMHNEFVVKSLNVWMCVWWPTL